MWPYGHKACSQDQCGLVFADRYRARDELWQMAIATVSFNEIPFSLPNMAGYSLKSYHYFYSGILAIFQPLGLPLLTLQYRLLPAIWLFLYIVLSLSIAHRLKPNPSFKIWYLICQLFTGSFGFIFAFKADNPWLNMSGINYQSPTYLANLPLAWSVIIILAILFTLLGQRKQISSQGSVILACLLVLAWGFKFYAGVIALILLFSFLASSIHKQNITVSKGMLKGFLYLLLSIGTIGIVYRPDWNGSIFSWAPLLSTHSIIEDPGKLYQPDLVNARYYLLGTGLWGPRLLTIELFTVIIYFVFSAGIRLIGLGYLIRKIFKKRSSAVDLWLLVSIGTSFILAISLIQHGDVFNPTQFFAYGLLLLNLYTAMQLDKWWSHSHLLKLACLIIIALAVPETVSQIAQTRGPKAVIIPEAEMEALQHLSNLPKGTVYTYPFMASGSALPKTLSKSIDTAYVTALSGKHTINAFTPQLHLLGYSPESSTSTESSADYYYLLKNHPHYQDVYESPYRLIFENEIVALYINSKE
jgi:hypothetical protein